ncbi:MAG: Era-like GTP-binding protein, partial [Pseudanabaena sp.]
PMRKSYNIYIVLTLIALFLQKTKTNKPIYTDLAYELLVKYHDLFRSELSSREIEEIAFLQEKLDKFSISIAVFGMVSKGKTSLLNALFGQKLGETGAIHGVTKGTSIYEWKIPMDSPTDGETHHKLELQLIDTQGLDEVGGEIGGANALEAAKRADLILFVIAGDMTRLEQEAIAQLQNFYKPILLVFNKADLYPECDRHAIYQALQNEEMRKLISPQEIVYTVADPLPVKVRLQYSDGNTRQEVWEKPQPNVNNLKSRILSLLNTEGKALLAVNALRGLLEIQDAVTQRHLQKVQSSTAITALLFSVESLGLLISPHLWLDGLISGACQSVLALWLIGRFPSQKKYMWLLLIVVIACLSGELGLDSKDIRYLQILWTGLSVSILFRGIVADLNHSRGYGKLGAKKLMEVIFKSVHTDSILWRFHNYLVQG